MKHKIQLNEVKVKDLSSHGQRKHPIKRNKRPYQKHDYDRDRKQETNSPYYRRVVRQSLISLTVIVCVLVMSSVDYKIFNDATKGIDYLVNHEFSFNEIFSVFNLDTDNNNSVIPAVSESETTFASPTKGEAVSDLLDDSDTKVGLIYSVPDGLCYASADGVVFYIDKVSASNPYIRIRHDDGFDTLYMGIISDVEIGDKVEQGDEIGKSVGDSMGFVLLKNSKYADITPHMTTTP